MANLYQEIRYPLGEASDRMVTVSVFQSRVKLHIRQFYRDYYGKLRAGKTGITISVEEFQEFTKLIPKLQQDVLNMNFKLLEDEKPEVVFPGDLDVTIIPSSPSPPSSAVDTDVNHEMLTPQWMENEIIDVILVQLEADTQPQSSKRWKNKDEDTYEKCKKKIRKTSKATQTTVEKKNGNKENGEKKKKVSVKRECIDEVETCEAMPKVEKLLWLTHYNLLCAEFQRVLHEKCEECQEDVPNQLGHKLCTMADIGGQMLVCFDETYSRVDWNTVLEAWHKKINEELTVVLNPKVLMLFQESINHQDEQYIPRLRKWMYESPTIEL